MKLKVHPTNDDMTSPLYHEAYSEISSKCEKCILDDAVSWRNKQLLMFARYLNWGSFKADILPSIYFVHGPELFCVYLQANFSSFQLL